jgi:hypothetical protein
MNFLPPYKNRQNSTGSSHVSPDFGFVVMGIETRKGVC